MKRSNDSATATTTKQGENKMNSNNTPAHRTVMPQTLFEEKIAQITCENNRVENSFSHTELANLAVEYKKLNNAEFHFSLLTNVHFTANLMYGAEFKYAELTDVEFRDCNMEHCSFDFARFHNVSFVNCILSRAEFNLSSGDVKFENCALGGSEFPMVHLEVQFQHCDLARAEINGCPDLKIQAEECDCHNAEFNDSMFSGKFAKCILTEAEFYSTDGRKLSFVDNAMRSIETKGALGISGLQDEDDEDFDL